MGASAPHASTPSNAGSTAVPSSAHAVAHPASATTAAEALGVWIEAAVGEVFEACGFSDNMLHDDARCGLNAVGRDISESSRKRRASFTALCMNADVAPEDDDPSLEKVQETPVALLAPSSAIPQRGSSTDVAIVKTVTTDPAGIGGQATACVQRIETSLEELFRLHDLNQDGVLEELELIKLNEKIAMLHHGIDTDRGAVKAKFKALFRSQLDPEGRPVPFAKFREYMLQVLRELDRDPRAQELILEQFIVEAKSGRVCFHCKSFESISDAPFRVGIEPTEFGVSIPNTA